MNEFWLWFWRPIAEVLGTIALIGTVIIAVFVGLVIYALYIGVKQKFCSHDFYSVNGQWQPARWRCRDCGLEKLPVAGHDYAASASPTERNK